MPRNTGEDGGGLTVKAREFLGVPRGDVVEIPDVQQGRELLHLNHRQLDLLLLPDGVAGVDVGVEVGEEQDTRTVGEDVDVIEVGTVMDPVVLVLGVSLLGVEGHALDAADGTVNFLMPSLRVQITVEIRREGIGGDPRAGAVDILYELNN